MGVEMVFTGAGARLEPCEVELLAAAEREHGRATLLVPTFGERDACRRELARAGCGVGVEVATPAVWIASLWELFGDGRQLVGSFERQALIAAILDASEPARIAPLRNNPGTVRLLARMARDLVPYAADAPQAGGAASAAAESAAALTETDDMVLDLLEAYRAAAARYGFVEASEAAELLAGLFEGRPPAALRAVAVRDVSTVPAYLLRLLGFVARGGAVAGAGGAARGMGEGRVAWLLGAGQEGFCADLEAAFTQAGCAVVQRDLRRAPACAPAAPSARAAFLEVAGPHAKARAYVDEALRLLGAAEADTTQAQALAAEAAADVALAHPRPAEVFFELAPRLAAAGAHATVRARVGWNESMAGRQFAALTDLAARMEEAGADPLRAGEWWPAPELSDWLRCPLSGVDASYALEFDKCVRGHREYLPAKVASMLQSVQDKQNKQRVVRAGSDAPRPSAAAPAVCWDVWQAICQGRPVPALKAMLEVARALPASAFGRAEGPARQRLECALLEAAIEAVGVRAHELGVSQGVAVTVLDSLMVSLPLEAGPCEEIASQGGEPAAPALGRVRIMRLDEAALLPAQSISGLLVADVDVEHYPLKCDESLETALAERLGRPPLAMAPAARQRAQFARALDVPVQSAVLARVTHDGQAKDRYPAAMWTELLMAAGVAPRVRGEADIVADLDPRSGAGLRIERVSCLPAQVLSPAAVPYTVLKERDKTTGQLRPRRLSASQIESYCACPLCWFVGSRVKPKRLDAGFGGMEEGNFVHDVMERFHELLRERGLSRPLPGNVAACLDVLDEAFGEVRAAHAQGRTATSGPLVAHSPLDDARFEVVLKHLRAAVRYEADALAGFAPTRFEYSFDGLDATYAGRPLGGRIDRVDEDAAGAAVVIDYKHRADDQFKLSDPTVPSAPKGRGKKAAPAPAEPREVAPGWLPKHTQALVYAQVLERTGAVREVHGALYFLTKGASPGMKGAVSEELVCRVPGLEGRVAGSGGFPGVGGAWSFQDLLDHVEAAIALRLDEMDAGNVAAAAERARSCDYNHPLGFGKRGA